MKRFIAIVSIFLFISLCCNTINVFANPDPKILPQGIYNAKNENLLIGSSLTATISPATSKAIIIIIDSDQTIEALVRLSPQVARQTLPPLNYDSSLIIFSNGSVILS